MKATRFVCVLLLLVAGCGPAGQPPRANAPRREVTLVELPIHRPEEADRVALPDLVAANNAMAVELYHQLRPDPGNFLVSPGCLAAGLGMLRAGARGETAEELGRVLHQVGSIQGRSSAALIQDLNEDGKNKGFQVRLANAVWVQEGFPLEAAYRTTLVDVFAIRDEVQIDFHRRDRAAKVINRWVSERTGGKIAEVVTPGAFPESTKLFLSTALYFRGNWTEGFFRPRTKDAPFHLTMSRSVVVPMMEMAGEMSAHGYHDAGSFQVLSLACGTGEFAFDVLLPKKVDGLAELEAALTPEILAGLWPKLKRPDSIFVSLPRFQARSSRDLRRPLERLGLTRAFDPDRADFSGITGKANRLFVASIGHDTFIDVNEEGIEAAAFAGVFGADSIGGDETPVIRADHPFVYLIRDTDRGASSSWVD